MTEGTPDFDLRRYEFAEDPRKIRLENWLNSLEAWELPDLTSEQSYILDLPPVLVEKPRYTQLSFGF